jgi:hypothetical protein
MNTVTVGVSNVEQAVQRVAAAFGGEKQGPFLTFTSVDLL